MRFLGILLCFTGVTFAQNVTNWEASAEFSIDEISLLNRQFLDFLLSYDVTQVEPSSGQRCVSTLKQLSEAYVNRDRHGLQWFDSWGKIPSGLYYGNGYAIGNYEQCRRFSWKDVRGQHCTFMATFPNEFPTFYSGLCVPQFCTQQVVQELYTKYMSSRGVRVLPAVDCYKDRELEFNGAVVTAIVIFSVFAGLVTCSTLYEVVQLNRNRKIQAQYASFSLYRNLRSILHLVHQPTNPAKKSEMIECANGIRSLSMVWIISLHVHFIINTVYYDNPLSRDEYMRGFPATLMYHVGNFAVDTFLALSGMFVSLNLLKELDQKGKINPWKLYLRRYIRLTAPFAPLILYVVTFNEYTGEGPLWNTFIGRHKNNCQKYWWSTLLHVQNYVQSPGDFCLRWTWYVSVDMQLYILAPALIYPMWRWGKRALLGVGVLAMAGIICVFTTFLVNDLRIADEGLRKDLTYYPTHSRMAVWLFGTIFGYILHRKKETRVDLPKKYYVLGWSSCFAILSVIIYATFELTQTNPQEFSNLADAFFESLSRPLFGICVMWIIFACVNGHGGVVNDFLSSPLWQPLARLSYTMYLLHLEVIIVTTLSSMKTEQHFSAMDMLYRLWGAVGLTTSVALVWSAVFEVPCLTLEKFVFGRLDNKKS